jgi:DNA-binding beta-propeller fold protein YncE
MSSVTTRYRFCRRGFQVPAAGTVLGVAAMLVVSATLTPGSLRPRGLGRDHLVAVAKLPEMSSEKCPLMPASAAMSLSAALQQSGTSTAEGGPAGSAESSRPSEALRDEVAKRQPVREIRDPGAAFAGVAVDPVRNEVVLADENLFNLMVYNRTENTPPAAKMSEPKRMIGGPKSYLEYTCNVYIDPSTGDIYGVNNDTMDWVAMFDRNAKGDAAPTRKLATPHTTFGIAVDEQTQEMYLTIQDDHAVVVYKKTASEQDDALRSLQGPHTQLADPHGIALDSKTNLMYVTNWGSSNLRKYPAAGAAASDSSDEGSEESYRGSFTAEGRKANWPVDRNHNIPGSGKLEPPSITVYSKDAKGDTPPLRVIQGPKTELDWPSSIAVDPDRGEIFVANDTGDSITVYRADASGDAAPIRVLKGPRTLIQNPTGVAVDLKNKELWVANFGNHSATVFPLDASGDAVPKRIIRSAPLDQPAPMLGNPHTVAYDSKRDQILVGN